MVADPVHQASPPLQAFIVSIESDSAMTELNPRRFARIRPSFIAIASAIDADETWGMYFIDAATNRQDVKFILLEFKPSHRKRIYGAPMARLHKNQNLPAIGSDFRTNLGRLLFFSPRPYK
jgi:hypothetical protein